MAEKKKPAFKEKLGRIRVVAWANQGEGSDTWYNVEITRRYRDSNGKWADANTFRRDDLPIVMKAADMAYDWIWKRKVAESDPIED